MTSRWVAMSTSATTWIKAMTTMAYWARRILVTPATCGPSRRRPGAPRHRTTVTDVKGGRSSKRVAYRPDWCVTELKPI
jgi:hypothetical protein